MLYIGRNICNGYYVLYRGVYIYMLVCVLPDKLYNTVYVILIHYGERLPATAKIAYLSYTGIRNYIVTNHTMEMNPGDICTTYFKKRYLCNIRYWMLMHCNNMINVDT